PAILRHMVPATSCYKHFELVAVRAEACLEVRSARSPAYTPGSSPTCWEAQVTTIAGIHCGTTSVVLTPKLDVINGREVYPCLRDTVVVVVREQRKVDVISRLFSDSNV